MKTVCKRLKKSVETLDRAKAYSLEEAVKLLKEVPAVKFDESVDLSIHLDIDPKQSEQMVRGTVVLPHGLGKTVRIAVFCKGEDVKKAKEAGAETVGDLDLVEKINSGWLDFDVAIATPEMMRDVGRLGKVLGPRGLMPNPKTGTVNADVARAIKEVKSGKIEFKMDKQANINLTVGKISFAPEKIIDNARTVIEALLRAKPAAVKGRFVKNITISSTMGIGLRLDLATVAKG